MVVRRRHRRPERLADSISHALVVTLVGVATAVPAIFFYTFFKSRLAVIAMNTSNLADDDNEPAPADLNR